MNRLAQQSKKWWTRERTLEGLKRFYLDFQLLPTCSVRYGDLKAFTGETRNGRSSNQGWKQKYPVAAQVSYHFGGMRKAWEAVGAAYPELKIQVDRTHEDWRVEEDWFITESVGIIPRVEVAELLRRTQPAIKRRLYDLRVNVYDRWGWTVNKVARVLQVPSAALYKYLEHGLLPFFQGNKCIFVDPADLVGVVNEYNWAKKRHPKELEDAIKKSLAQRLCYTLLQYDWRRYRYHKIQPLINSRSGLVQNSSPPPATVPPPADIKEGAWVRVTAPTRAAGPPGRIGKVTLLFWTRQRGRASVHGGKARWRAIVEFRKLSRGGRARVSLVSYGFAVEALEVVKNGAELAPQKPPLKCGTWVRLTSTFGTTGCSAGRVAQVKRVYWSQTSIVRHGKTLSGPCWMAAVECEKLAHGGRHNVRKVTYCVPVSVVEQISKKETVRKAPFKPGAWVRVVRDYPVTGCTVGRVGKVLSVRWSSRQGPRAGRRETPIWIATVEFEKRRPYTRPDVKYIRYWVAASHLEETAKPRQSRSTTKGGAKSAALRKAA